MKMEKIGKKIIVAITVVMVLCTGVAYAGVNCPSANVTEVGVYPYLPDTTRFIVYATCDDTSKWSGEIKFFIAKDSHAASLYAAALTAATTGNKVNILATSTNYGVVKMLSVKAAP